MRGVLGVVIGLVLLLAFLTIFGGPLDSVISEAATDVDSVTTAAAVTTGSLTLDDPHFFNDQSNLDVTCDTDAAPTVVLAADRVTVNLSGLTASTTQDCTSTYIRELQDTDGNVEDFVQLFELAPLFSAIGILGLALGGIAVGVGASGFGGSRASSIIGSVNIGSFLISLVALLMTPVVNNFVNTAEAFYGIRPEYVGTEALLGLVLVGFAVSVLSLLVGTGVGAGRGLLGR